MQTNLFVTFISQHLGGSHHKKQNAGADACATRLAQGNNMSNAYSNRFSLRLMTSIRFEGARQMHSLNDHIV